MNTRRTARLQRLGVRLCEANGTISTSRSRAAARLDAAKTKAATYHIGLR